MDGPFGCSLCPHRDWFDMSSNTKFAFIPMRFSELERKRFHVLYVLRTPYESLQSIRRKHTISTTDPSTPGYVTYPPKVYTFLVFTKLLLFYCLMRYRFYHYFCKANMYMPAFHKIVKYYNHSIYNRAKVLSSAQGKNITVKLVRKVFTILLLALEILFDIRH